MSEVCRRVAAEGLSIFLDGSTDATLDLLKRGLKESAPNLVVAGTQASRFRSASKAEREVDLVKIKESGASVVFVGLGCPRQEI